MNEYGKCITQHLLADFAELERRMIAHFLVKNKKAKQQPARKRKVLYGKAKQPYTIVHDEIQVHAPLNFTVRVRS